MSLNGTHLSAVSSSIVDPDVPPTSERLFDSDYFQQVELFGLGIEWQDPGSFGVASAEDASQLETMTPIKQEKREDEPVLGSSEPEKKHTRADMEQQNHLTDETPSTNYEKKIKKQQALLEKSIAKRVSLVRPENPTPEQAKSYRKLRNKESARISRINKKISELQHKAKIDALSRQNKAQVQQISLLEKACQEKDVTIEALYQRVAMLEQALGTQPSVASGAKSQGQDFQINIATSGGDQLLVQYRPERFLRVSTSSLREESAKQKYAP